MMTTQAIKNHVSQKFGTVPEVDPFDGVSMSLEEVERLIKWLGYVSDSEYTEAEERRIVAGAKRFAAILQPIASKYLD